MKKICFILLMVLVTPCNTFTHPNFLKNRAAKYPSKLRFKSSSNLDPSFGTNGVVDTNLATEDGTSSRDIANSIAVQSDGKLVIGGITTAIDNFINFSLARYTTAGKLDDSFGTKGVVTTDVGELIGAGKDTSYSFINSIAIQSDGKIVAGGSTNNPTNFIYNFALVRYNVDGTVDRNFGNNGAVTTDVALILGTANTQSTIESIVIQPDGKILAGGFAGANLAIARYNTDGTLDTSFGGTGVIQNTAITANNNMNIILQADNKIVGGGTINKKFALARYDTNGIIDGTFGTAGIVTTSFGSNFNSIITNIGIDSTQKIIAGGFSIDNTNTFYFTMARYNTNGSLDATFGTGGKVNTNLDSQEIVISRLTVQTDDKIITGGAILGATDTNLNGTTFILTRVNTNGTLDTTFNSTGIVITNFGNVIHNPNPSVDTLYSVFVDNTSGNIFASGSTTCVDLNYDYGIAKYKSNGSLDTAYGNLVDLNTGNTTGLIDTDYKTVLGITAGAENSAAGIGTLSTGNIVVGGISDVFDPNYDFGFALYDTTGSIQKFNTVDFSSYSNFNNKIYGTYDLCNDIAIQNDDKIVAAGLSNTFGGPFSFALTRLNSDLSKDSFFGQNALVVTNFGQLQNKQLTSDTASSVIMQNDSKILAGGSTGNSSGSQSSFALSRYFSDGTLDGNFGSLKLGIVITNIGKTLGSTQSFDFIQSVALQNDNKILAGGLSTYQNPFGNFALARYNPDGTLDDSFGNKGIVITNFNSSQTNGSQINKVVIQTDGQILVGGITTVPNFNPSNQRFNFALARYNSDGTLDKTFGNKGLVVTVLNPNGNNSKSNDYLSSLTIKQDGTIIAGGSSNATDPNFDYVLVLYTTSGTVVKNNGIIFTDFATVLGVGSNSQDSINQNGLAIQTDGKILASGNTNATNSNFDFSIARYKIATCLNTKDTFTKALFAKYGQ